jgi:myosin heavy subunit
MADSVINYSDLIGKDDTFDDIFANIDRLKKELSDLAKQAQKDLDLINPNNEEELKKATAQVEKLTKASKQLETERKKAIKTRKKVNELTDEELIQREKLKIANRERVQIAKQQAILLNKEAGEIEKLRAKLSLTTLEWKKLSKNELENTKRGKDLIKTKKRLTEELKRLEKQTGDTRRNVGNYTSSLGRLGKAASAVFLGRSLVDGLRRISSFFTELVDKNKEFNSTLGGISKGFEGVSTALAFAGTKLLEFLAPAINVITDALAKLPAFFAGAAAGARQFASNTIDQFRKLSLQIQIAFQTINRANPFSDESQEQITQNINRLRQQIRTINEDQRSVGEAFNEAFEETIRAQEEFAKQQKENELAAEKAEKKKAAADKAREQAIKRQNELLALQQSIEQNISSRLDAIVSLQNQIEQAEANAIEDSTERLLRLEELKAKAINEQREKQFQAFVTLLEKQEEELIKFYGENSDEVIKFREEAGKELLAVEAKNQELSELQLEASEKRKQAIREKFAIKAIEIQTKTVSDAVALEGIAATTQKVGEAINAAFEKQLDLASTLVEQQAEAVETQRQRAEQGLENTLAFEQQQLAQREAERIRAEQKAKQAAEFITLLNLVSSYAASGDTNALARGLVDFSLLKALETGFEEGGYTGDNGKSQISGVVHGQEFVVTADDVKKYGLTGKGGDEFGEAMSDYFYSPLQQNLYGSQADNFKKGMTVVNRFTSLENEVREMRKAFQSMPQKDYDLLQMTDYFVEISKRVTQNRLTNVSKQRKRL